MLPEQYMMPRNGFELLQIHSYWTTLAGRLVLESGYESRYSTSVRVGTIDDWRRVATHGACEGNCIPFRCKLCRRIVGGCIGCGDVFDEKYGPACDDCAVSHPAWSTPDHADR
jgi:hypothetical protein